MPNCSLDGVRSVTEKGQARETLERIRGLLKLKDERIIQCVVTHFEKETVRIVQLILIQGGFAGSGLTLNSANGDWDVEWGKSLNNVYVAAQ